jgi:aryl carrier-like protein
MTTTIDAEHQARDRRVLHALRDLRRRLAEAHQEIRRLKPDVADPPSLSRLVAGECGWPPESIDATTNLFHYGLDSIQAAQVRRGLERATGRTLPPTLLFDHPTLEQLAVYLASGDGAHHTARAPLTYGQDSVWLLDQLSPSSYHLRCVLELAPDASLDALGSAVDVVIARHAVLRSRIVEQAGCRWQIVETRRQPTLEVSALSSDACGVDVWVVEQSLAPIDLSHGPLVRFVIRTDPAGRMILLIVLHHIVGDFSTLRTIVGELEAAYDALRTGARLLPMPEYHMFARGEQERTQPPAHWDALCREWRGLLPVAPPVLRLPNSRTRNEASTKYGVEFVQVLPPRLIERVRRYAADRSATAFQVLFCAYAALLTARLDEPEIVIGTTRDGRTSEAEAHAAGYFVNVVPILCSAATADWTAFLTEHRRRLAASLGLQAVPFPLIVERIAPPRLPFTSPVVQTLFTVVDGGGCGKGHLFIRRVRLSGHAAASVTHDIVLIVESAADTDVCVWGYRPGLFDRSFIESLAAAYVDVLEGAVSGVDVVTELLARRDRVAL